MALNSKGSITNSLYVGNRSDEGGAMYIFDDDNSNSYKLINNTFFNNQANSGGALFIDNSPVTLDQDPANQPIQITNSILRLV